MTWRTGKSLRLTAAVGIAAAVAIFLGVCSADAQGLSVLPVNVFLSPGQRAASLTLTNNGDRPTSMQVRAFDWSQTNDEDQLTGSKVLAVSPPLFTIPPKGTQVVRLILRQPAVGGEATYRIILDQIPGPKEPGVVQMVLRLSIPVFAPPETKVAPKIQFHLERDGERLFLVGINTGKSHDTLHDITVTASDGRKFNPKTKVSPYLLAGATRRWELDAQGYAPKQAESLKLTAHGINGDIDEQIGVAVTP
jgi:fimbrial chaperone protein